MMKIIKLTFLIIFVATLRLCYAQPRIPKEEIPSDISKYLKEDIERLYSKNPVRRGYAVRELGQYKEYADIVVPILIEMLEDDTELVWRPFSITEGYYPGGECTTVGREAAGALRRLGKASTTKPLINVIKNVDHLHAKENAVLVLGEQAQPETVVILFDVIWDYPSIANKAIEALSKIRDSRAVEALIVVLEKGNDKVKLKAKETLVKLLEVNFDEDYKKWREWWQENKKEVLDKPHVFWKMREW